MLSKQEPLRYVLAVVDPDYPVDINVKELQENTKLFRLAAKFAERNGLYFYFIFRLDKMGLKNSQSEDIKWIRETQKLSEFKKTLWLINRVSDNCGVDYSVIKACDRIPHIPRDIDIFVRSEDRAKIINVLADNGMRCVHRGVAETSLKGENDLKVDVYTRICYIGLDFIDENYLIQSIVNHEFFNIGYAGLNNEANLLLMVVHSLFGHGCMSLLDFLHINCLMKNADVDACRKYAYDRGWGSVLDSVLEELDVLHEKIYKKGNFVHFPYSFDQKFILKCISEIEGLEMRATEKIFLITSLIHEKIVLQLKDTSLYNLLKSFETVGNAINSLTSSIKARRGDIKSVDTEKRNET